MCVHVRPLVTDVASHARFILKHSNSVFRYYAKTIGSGATAVHLVVAHTSCFVDKYLTSSSPYSVTDEEQACVSFKPRTSNAPFGLLFCGV